MARWRKVVGRKRVPQSWSLQLECGHEAYRSDRCEIEELPRFVSCQACNSLIGTHVKSSVGKVGRISSYGKGSFVIAWDDDGTTRSTLDELREHLEFVA